MEGSAFLITNFSYLFSYSYQSVLEDASLNNIRCQSRVLNAKQIYEVSNTRQAPSMRVLGMPSYNYYWRCAYNFQDQLNCDILKYGSSYTTITCEPASQFLYDTAKYDAFNDPFLNLIKLVNSHGQGTRSQIRVSWNCIKSYSASNTIINSM